MISKKIYDQIETIKNVELWYEPGRNLQADKPLVSEMVEKDHAFLCGMIRELKPKKIVEMGVAEGGTTAVIMNCLRILDIDSQVYSVDLNEKLYYDKNRETGYIWKDMSNYFDGKSTHEFKVGKTIAGFIDEIGKDVDFVIMDTMHMLPGELLDFLCILPYLNEKATVVLHDISLNYINSFSDDMLTIFAAKNSDATKILYSTVTAQKWFYFEDEPGFNIAAFTVNEDTVKYISDCFQALGLTWEYSLSDTVLAEYRNIFLRYYNEQCVQLYDLAIKANNHMINIFKVMKKNLLYDYLPKSATFAREEIERLKSTERIILYGAGIIAVETIKILRENGIDIFAIAVSDTNKNVKKLCGVEVRDIKELQEFHSAEIIIASTLEPYICEMEANLKKMGFCYITKVGKKTNRDNSDKANSYKAPQFYK